jgi:nucleoid DNA-binding protein
MALHVTLTRDSFKGDGSLRPRIVQTDTVNMDSLLKYMATDTALEEIDMRATVSRFGEALAFYLTMGEKVVTPFGTIHVSARGTHVGRETPRVESRNLRINFRPAPWLLNHLRASTKIVMEGLLGRKLPAISSVINAEADGTDHRMAVYSRTGSVRINFKPAETPVGTYTLEVRTRPSQRDVWVGMSSEAFTVAS